MKVFNVRSHLVLKRWRGEKHQVNFSGKITVFILPLAMWNIPNILRNTLTLPVCERAPCESHPTLTPPVCASLNSLLGSRWFPRSRDNIGFIKLATASSEGETMLLMFWLCINEQPGQRGTCQKSYRVRKPPTSGWTLHSGSVNDVGWKELIAVGEQVESLWCRLASWPH